MKKVLIIGASLLQLPAIQRAKEMGFYVGVADYNPHAVGIPFADEYFNVSTIDVEGVVAVAKAFGPDGIMTLATDMPMRAVAAACEALGLPGISSDTAFRSTDKGAMIRAFEAHGVAHPWYLVIRNEEELDAARERITYPCVSKPTDNSGSRGVSIVLSPEQLKEAFRYSSQNGRNGEVIIEDYMKGQEVSVEVMVLNGQPHVLQVTDKLTTGAPHFVEMGHSQPSMLPPSDVAAVKELAERAVRAVGIANGPAHVEIMLTADGPKMVELGARMGGDNITTHLVPLSTGIDMVGETVRLACGEAVDIEPKFSRGSAIRYFDACCGTIQSITGVEEAKAIPGVEEICFVKGVGDAVGEIDSSLARVGFVMAQADTPQEAVKLCEEAMAHITVTL